MNINDILVAIDINSPSENIIDFALEFALGTESRLTFLYAIEPNLPDNSSSDPDVLGLQSENLKALVEKVKLKSNSKVSDLNYIVDHGYYGSKIAEACNKINAGAIIMGIHTDKTKNENVFSGTLKDLMSKINVPLIFIPKSYRLTTIDRFLYTVDFNFEEIEVMLDIVSIAKKIDAKVTGLHIWEGDEILESVQQNINTYRRLFKYRSKKNQLGFELKMGNASHEILEHISNNEIDILCMMVHDYKPLSRLFKPSISGKVIKKIKIPFMIIRSFQSEPIVIREDSYAEISDDDFI